MGRRPYDEESKKAAEQGVLIFFALSSIVISNIILTFCFYILYTVYNESLERTIVWHFKQLSIMLTFVW